ncbi:MAG: RND family transporter [Lachnospiraceae bacterium]
MKQFYKVIIEHPKLILTTFTVIFIICVFLRPMIEVDYDMNDYLPEESASTVALDVMEEEFGGGIPNARVLVKDVTIPQALEYKAQMETIDGVTSVTWLDDAVSVEVPLETLDTATVEDYYKDGNALFSVTIEDDKRISAVDDIRALIGEDNAMTGSAVSSAIATVSTEKEIAKIVLFAVIFVFIVLFITTTSWLEPIMIMVGLGIAVIINAGTNIIFGKISFVTNAAGNILQLAVSLDYSVFLLHRFNECRKHYPDAKEAMLEALSMSTSSILSSGLTTVIGFLALCLMKFQLGSDLGRALAKGILISLITVFVFMPVLILVSHTWIDKLEHRPLLPSFQRFGKVVTKIMFPMVIVFLLILVPSNLASNSNSFYYGSSHIFGTNTQLGRDTQMIEDIFGKSDTYVLLVPKDDKSVQKELSDALHEIPKVSSIISYVDTVGMEIPEEYLDKSDYDALCSEHYTRMVLSLDTEYEGEKTFALVKEIRDTAEKYYPGEWYLAGEGVSTYDLMDTISTDMVRVNFVAIAAVFVVLLLTLRSFVLPVILVLGIETAIWVNLSFPYFMDKKVFYIAYLIISSVQLGATVDYAILLTDRYKEFRQTMQKKDSVIQTISSVTVSILTSGSVLAVVGFLLGMFSSHGILSQLGFFIGRGSLCSLVIVLFALPGLLYIFDKTFIKRK